jgi:hypothetical protein
MRSISELPRGASGLAQRVAVDDHAACAMAKKTRPPPTQQAAVEETLSAIKERESCREHS